MLQNNSNEMKTVVETFFIEETISLIHDNDELTRWNDMISFLDLKGQKKLLKDDKSPIPFMWMNQSTENVFSTLCPRKVDVIDYNKTPIPIEILELISLSRREKYFDFIEIWYDENTPDPACVGYAVMDGYKEKEEYWKRAYSEKYLLGKWADVRRPYSELVEMAKKRFTVQKRNELKTAIKNAQRELEDLEITADNKFGI